MAVTVAAYGLPTWVSGRLVVVIVSGAGRTVIDRLREATKGPGGVVEVGVASVTVTAKLVVPATVGVPEITPVEELRLRPAGRLPAVIDQEYGVVPPMPARVAA